MHIPVSSVIYIESLGHEVLVHTKDGVYMSSGRLIQLEKVSRVHEIFSLDVKQPY